MQKILKYDIMKWKEIRQKERSRISDFEIRNRNQYLFIQYPLLDRKRLVFYGYIVRINDKLIFVKAIYRQNLCGVVFLKSSSYCVDFLIVDNSFNIHIHCLIYKSIKRLNTFKLSFASTECRLNIGSTFVASNRTWKTKAHIMAEGQ